MKQDNKERQIRDAQYRKSRSIAFFNATNAAIELVKANQAISWEKADVFGMVTDLRDKFLAEYDKDYAENISKIGQSFDASEAIRKIESVESEEQLYQIWISLSEDERHHPEILKAKDSMKEKYAKTK